MAVDDDPELDDIPREQLGEGSLGELPVHVLESLEAWAAERDAAADRHDERWHGVGAFLDELAARGYRVRPIEVLRFDKGGFWPPGVTIVNNSGQPIRIAPVLAPPTE